MIVNRRVDSPEQAAKDDDYRLPLVELLYQLADDDLLAGFRASEWLGLAPHIEADVAFSSIAQNTVGHGAMMYELLEALGEGKADDLVHLREAEQYRNATLTERVNGTGSYLEEPRYDWAFAVARYYVYEQAKAVKHASLADGSFVPLAQLAVKISREQQYHLMHWDMWVTHLADSTADAYRRLVNAFDRVLPEVDELFSMGAHEKRIVGAGLIESSTILRDRWMARVGGTLDRVYNEREKWKKHLYATLADGGPNGRNGEHTDDLSQAIDTLSCVYREDPVASW